MAKKKVVEKEVEAKKAKKKGKGKKAMFARDFGKGKE